MAGRLSAASDLEGRRYGISVICLSPGAVETEMLRRANPQLRAGLKDCVVEFRSRVSLHTERSTYRRWSSL